MKPNSIKKMAEKFHDILQDGFLICDKFVNIVVKEITWL